MSFIQIPLQCLLTWQWYKPYVFFIVNPHLQGTMTQKLTSREKVESHYFVVCFSPVVWDVFAPQLKWCIIPWKSKTKQKKCFRMIHVKDSVCSNVESVHFPGALTWHRSIVFSLAWHCLMEPNTSKHYFLSMSCSSRWELPPNMKKILFKMGIFPKNTCDIWRKTRKWHHYHQVVIFWGFRIVPFLSDWPPDSPEYRSVHGDSDFAVQHLGIFLSLGWPNFLFEKMKYPPWN